MLGLASRLRLLTCFEQETPDESPLKYRGPPPVSPAFSSALWSLQRRRARHPDSRLWAIDLGLVCADADLDGITTTADALTILRSAIGAAECDTVDDQRITVATNVLPRNQKENSSLTGTPETLHLGRVLKAAWNASRLPASTPRAGAGSSVQRI